MRYLAIVTILSIFISFPAVADVGIGLLPEGGNYDSSIPKPVDVFGFRAGEQHVRHDQLVNYFRALAESSDRVVVETTGRTHEGREQLLAIITSPKNHANLEQIRKQHLAVAAGEAKPGSAPVILWQGYSIHGDESSGSNAVPLYAWHLAANKDPQVAKMLDNVVVLIDPSLNPDGMARYAAWTTMQRSNAIVTDENHIEHNQQWPTGRGNHYWFDLNRDWLLLQHPESRNRLNILNRWRPHVVTDHHEMGKNSTFFFQPGVPDRTHPLTPKRNQQLTAQIAEYHAKHLDAIGRLYYAEESFDDFYYGKGSTYPDITGGIGILFEQASSEGQAIETPFGDRTFAESVQNQLTTSLSTLEAAYEMRDDLREYQAQFFADARDNGKGAWVVSEADNPARMKAFLSNLEGHGIRFAPLDERVRENGKVFEAGKAWVIPMNQPQARLIEAMFDTRVEFENNTFYDVSTWTFPHAFDLPYARLSSVPDIGTLQHAAPKNSTRFTTSDNAAAYGIDWRSDAAPALLQELLENDIKVMATTEPLPLDNSRSLVRGSFLVPLGMQRDKRDEIERIINAAAADDALVVHALGTGLLPGVDLGSPSIVTLEQPKVLLLIGAGTNSLEVGEFWHFADTRLDMPVTRIDRAHFGGIDIGNYTHIIMVDGRGSGWGEDEAVRLHQWMNAGGVLVTQQNAADWATDFRLYLSSGERERELDKHKDGFRAAVREQEDKEKRDAAAKRTRANYADFEQAYAKELVSGTIFMTDADTTHPLAYGLADRDLAVFKDRSETLPASGNPYATVARFIEQPLVSGYSSKENTEAIAGSAAVLADRVGRGLLVRFAIDPLFRSYWRGTERLMVNALYLGQAVRSTELD